MTRPRGGPPWLQLSPAQLPGPHPGSPVRPPVLRASCPRSPSPGLPPSPPGPALSCQHGPRHTLPDRHLPPRLPGQQDHGGGGGPLGTSGGRRGPAFSRARSPCPSATGPPPCEAPRSGLDWVRPLPPIREDQPGSFCPAGPGGSFVHVLVHSTSVYHMLLCSRPRWWARSWPPRGRDLSGRHTGIRETKVSRTAL